MQPRYLLAAGSLVLLVAFAVLFHDYRTGHFVSQGIVCLAAGLLDAIPAALASWLLLRRGFDALAYCGDAGKRGRERVVGRGSSKIR